MSDRRDLHQEITDKIVAAIEAGAGQWRMPWVGQQGGLPYNATTSARYRGVNVLSLWLASTAAGYPMGAWGSYRQWAEKGAQVRKGEKGTVVVFYKPLAVTRETESGETETDQIPMLRYSHVFNVAQVDGFEIERPALPALAQRIEAAEAFVSRTGAIIRYGMGRASYSPSLDRVAMPDWEAFIDTATATATENAYGTLLHELTHWTGHEKRCARDFSKRFGSDAYAAEELVAELGAAFLCARLGITAEPRADHAEYLAHWLKILRGDKRAIFTAASKASAAVDYLAGLQTVEQRQAA